MSPTGSTLGTGNMGFPRSRGDEPYEDYFTVYDGMFSPLTRG